MAKDLIRYDLLVQDALRGVVRKVLGNAAREGLQGEHHFYISFRTDRPGVRVSQRLREKYPQEMTIVLQHQFWDLGVTEHTFEVGLSFSGIPERLLVPFDALTGFFDPSVQFGLKFEVEEGERDEAPQTPPQDPQPEPARPLVPAVSKGTRSGPPMLAEAPPPAPAKLPAEEPAKAPPKPAPKRDRPAAAEASPKADAKTDTKSDAGAPSGAEVVSLDAFRKKN